jgi:hypothetical protein
MSPELIAALTGLVGVLLGGLEMRLAIGRLHAKVDRLEERLGTVERKHERWGGESATIVERNG